MSLIKLLYLFLFVIIISSIVTDVIRRYAIKNKLYDVPNKRSSHDIPKPKSGGVSIVLTILGTISFLYLFKMISLDVSVGIVIGLSIVSIIGLYDDYKNLSVSIRVVSYILAAFISLYSIGGLTTLSLNNISLNLDIIGYLFGVLFIVWLTNLYNFMDGTDGLAAIQTICTGFFTAGIFYFSGNFSLAIILLCLVASTMGFLWWNWSPAKIFMGDVGSCAIGFLFGLLAIYSEKEQLLPISIWLILLAPFIGDATFTLFKRILNNEKWYKAHNSHAYQKLYQLGWTHRGLATGLLIINVLIIWPFAYFAYEYKNFELVMIILSYSLIGGIWLKVQIRFKNLEKVIS